MMNVMIMVVWRLDTDLDFLDMNLAHEFCMLELNPRHVKLILAIVYGTMLVFFFLFFLPMISL